MYFEYYMNDMVYGLRKISHNNNYQCYNLNV